MKEKKTAVITGAAGFLGSILVETLQRSGTTIYAVVRPDSEHNIRLTEGINIQLVTADLSELTKIISQVGRKCDWFFHLAWSGGKRMEDQERNVAYTLEAVRVARELGCRRFLCTGSQAEYGIVLPEEIASEKRAVSPITAYGAAKVAACYMSKRLAQEFHMEWIWGRVFSLIGKNEPRGRMLPDLYAALCAGEEFHLSSCRQNWDYLDVYDAAEALIALVENGKDGEIYNIANGRYRKLRSYTEELRNMVGGIAKVSYGADTAPFISLQPSVEKIYQDTGWRAKREFAESVADYRNKEEA